MGISLVVLAAGMGSRYGGIKQLDRVGPSGETIMDYSIYDALGAGFNKVVFVIREHFADEFKNLFVNTLEETVDIRLVYQEIEKVPGNFSYNPERTKPWGTAHAMLMAKDVIDEPFAVINADDFYGRESYSIMANFLKNNTNSKIPEFSLCGYKLNNTLSEHGTVSRGVCKKSYDGFLETVIEHTSIQKEDDGNIYSNNNGIKTKLKAEDIVSMNFWGFTPSIFGYIENMFLSFLLKEGQDLKSEMYIPSVVDELIKKDLSKVKVLDTDASWFGVTYAEDKPKVINSVKSLIEKGLYPQNLWA